MDQPIKVKKKKGNGCLKIVIIAFVAFIAFGVLAAVLTTVFDNVEPKQSELAKVMALDGEQEATILKVFESCGIGEISSVQQFQSSEYRTSYYIDDKETAAYNGADNTIVVWIDNSKKSVQEIYFHDETIYADGEVKAQVPDFYVSEESRNNYRVSAQMLINQCLNYPDTAKYPSKSGWRFGVKDGYDIAQSEVSAKNAFGVTNTMPFSVKFDRETGVAVSVVLDGKEYVK